MPPGYEVGNSTNKSSNLVKIVGSEHATKGNTSLRKCQSKSSITRIFLPVSNLARSLSLPKMRASESGKRRTDVSNVPNENQRFLPPSTPFRFASDDVSNIGHTPHYQAEKKADAMQQNANADMVYEETVRYPQKDANSSADNWRDSEIEYLGAPLLVRSVSNADLPKEKKEVQDFINRKFNTGWNESSPHESTPLKRMPSLEDIGDMRNKILSLIREEAMEGRVPELEAAKIHIRNLASSLQPKGRHASEDSVSSVSSQSVDEQEAGSQNFTSSESADTKGESTIARDITSDVVREGQSGQSGNSTRTAEVHNNQRSSVKTKLQNKVQAFWESIKRGFHWIFGCFGSSEEKKKLEKAQTECSQERRSLLEKWKEIYKKLNALDGKIDSSNLRAIKKSLDELNEEMNSYSIKDESNVTFTKQTIQDWGKKLSLAEQQIGAEEDRVRKRELVQEIDNFILKITPLHKESKKVERSKVPLPVLKLIFHGESLWRELETLKARFIGRQQVHIAEWTNERKKLDDLKKEFQQVYRETNTALSRIKVNGQKSQQKIELAKRQRIQASVAVNLAICQNNLQNPAV